MLKIGTQIVFQDVGTKCDGIVEGYVGPSVYLIRCTDGIIPNRVHRDNPFFAGKCFVTRKMATPSLAEEKH